MDGDTGDVQITVYVVQPVFSDPLVPDWNVTFTTAPL
jgi:hypothetical protein